MNLRIITPFAIDRVLYAVTLLLAVSACALAQTSASSQTTSSAAPPEEPKSPYSVFQFIELGGHIEDHSGNDAIWSTFVNVSSGFRLINQGLEIAGPKGVGLFDRMSVSSFGFGGDPINVATVRVGRERLYGFSGSFRRDRNFFDYNLLANPLNPLNSNPVVIIQNSPHTFETVRRMVDANLTIFPQSRVTGRLNFLSVTNQGPSFSSNHQGTEAALAQNWQNVSDTYHGGIDFKLPRRTVISYDQYFTLYKGDTSWALNSLPLQLANGVPVDSGLISNTPANQPCAVPIANPATTPQTFTANCNGFLGYSRTSPTRNFYPTEQLSMQSSFLPRVDFAGRFSYNSGDSDVPNILESYTGFTSRNRTRGLDVFGPAFIRVINVSTDDAVSIRITDQLRFTNQFRWQDFRIPGSWNSQADALFAASLLITPNVFNPATCPPPFNGAGCPQHVSGSQADLTLTAFNTFLGQDTITNTSQFEYDFTRWFGARAGFRYRSRSIEHRDVQTVNEAFFPTLPNRGDCVGQPLDADGVCRVSSAASDSNKTDIHEYWGLFGFWVRPNERFRGSFDMELMSADNTFTRISPRKLQTYSIRVQYRPRPWASFSTAIELFERRNDRSDINNFQHNRSYNFNTVLAKSERWGVELGYGFQDIFSQSDICFVATPAPLGLISCGGSFLATTSLYSDNINFGHANLFWKPVQKLTANLGYTINSSSGQTTNLNPSTPEGPLQMTYQLPTGSLSYEFSRNWTGNFNWNYYGYNENSPPILIPARNVSGNVFTLSVRFTTGAPQ